MTTPARRPVGECRFHEQMDQQSRGLGIITVRCAHVGTEYIHERICFVEGRWWLNRTDRGHAIVKPELEAVTSEAEADRIFAAMEARMLAGAAFGEPYGVVE